MREITVTTNDSGQRLTKFLCKAFPLFPQGLMFKYIRKKSIKVNGKRTEHNYILAEGDIISLYVNDDLLLAADEDKAYLSVSGNIDVVFEDENILLINKPAGLLVHSDDSECIDTLVAKMQRYLYDRGEYQPENENSFAPALCNRIDRNTSGIVIAAKNAEALRIMNKIIKERTLTKRYLCAVHGSLKQINGTLKNYLRKNSSENKVYIEKSKTADNVTAITSYRVLCESNGLSLVEAEILTGRTHQIRAQFANIGHPLLGDTKYGLNKANTPYGFKHQALTSYYLRFDKADGALSYLTGKEFSIDKAEIPFLKFFNYNFER